MPAQISSGASSRPLLGSSSRGRQQEMARDRQAELAAAFGGSDDEEEEEDEGNSSIYGRGVDRNLINDASRPEPSSSSSPPLYTSSPQQHPRPLTPNDSDVFFDAGDALMQQSSNDPLGVERVNADRAHAIPEGSHQSHRPDRHNIQSNTDQRQTNSYDFEQASYFTPQRPVTSRQPSLLVSQTPNAGGMEGDSVEQEAHGDVSGLSREGVSPTNISRFRYALGRFGRFVGMRVPGATYSSLHGEEDHPANANRRRVMGSGINQDGVFANLNAKPERRRRRGENGEDRGEDDDLADDVLPPAYEVAAADAAPPYWETTIIGGPGGFHPLAPGGAGWTPGGPHVGALEDLIIEGLPLGNFFGLAWNLLVSMSFQFIGFLLTYLLHTTHAARCGSRAGLGITLVQYGFYLRTRAAQMMDGTLPEDMMGPGADPPLPPDQSNRISWFSDSAGMQQATSNEQTTSTLLTRGIHFVIRQAAETSATTTNSNGTLADALAADGNNTINLPSAESMSASTEWLAFILMGLGWFILLTSLFSYWRVHRWGTQLVEAARRENESNNETSTSTENENTEEISDNAPVGFLYTLRQALRNTREARRSRRQGRAHSAEDWIIFPGRPRRDLLDIPEHPQDGQSADLEAGNLSAEERRLLEDMRNVGLV